MTRRRPARAALGGALAFVVGAADAGAQSVGVEIGAGLATPVGGFGASRGPGPLVEIGAVQVNPDRRFRWRGQFEAAWMPGSGPATPLSGWRTGDARVLTALGGFTLGPRGNGGAGYFMLSIARHWMRIEGTRNPYGTLWGARIGAGVRWRMRGVSGRVEVAPHAILSDYGTTEYSAGAFWATTAGLTF